jgi:hypothetical protein
MPKLDGFSRKWTNIFSIGIGAAHKSRFMAEIAGEDGGDGVSG